jgi:hypothetical protein
MKNICICVTSRLAPYENFKWFKAINEDSTCLLPLSDDEIKEERRHMPRVRLEHVAPFAVLLVLCFCFKGSSLHQVY